MKNIRTVVSVLAIFLVTLSVSAQKGNKKNAFEDCFITAATAEFDLSEEDKATFIELRKERREKFASVGKEVRTKSITEDQAKVKRTEIHVAYTKEATKLTGQSNQELGAFTRETSAKCRKK